MGPHLPSSRTEGLGIENGSFKWNEVTEEDADKKNKHSEPELTSPSSSVAEVHHAVGGQTETQADHQFELKDISVRFPEGRLTVITGPTASGKTALLVRLRHRRSNKAD
jgi:excinuclease UvrABC ATPase subunit